MKTPRLKKKKKNFSYKTRVYAAAVEIDSGGKDL